MRRFWCVAGYWGPPLRKRYMGCGRRADVGIGPYGGLQEVRCGEVSPSHGFAVPAPFRQGGQGDGGRIVTASERTGFAMTHCKECGRAGRCGERTERCRWQRKRSERVAAVKILSVRRKAAQKFWAPQQGHRPLRKRILWCVGEGMVWGKRIGRTQACPP